MREAAPQGVTAILDAVGGDALEASVQLLDSTERIVTIADWANASRLGIRRIGTERSAAKLNDLTRLYTEGKLRVEVAATVPLAEAPEAHKLVETGHVRGKVALVVE